MGDERYEPEYPILERWMIKAEIELLDEDSLEPIVLQELKHLRETDAVYKAVYADIPQNREAIAFRAGYYQMVAFAEGWTFNPQRYQIRFIDPDDPVFGVPQLAMAASGNVIPIRQERERRVFSYRRTRTSPAEHLGIEIAGENVRFMNKYETKDTLHRVARIHDLCGLDDDL